MSIAGDITEPTPSNVATFLYIYLGTEMLPKIARPGFYFQSNFGR